MPLTQSQFFKNGSRNHVDFTLKHYMKIWLLVLGETSEKNSNRFKIKESFNCSKVIRIEAVIEHQNDAQHS